ncbi:MAG: condensation domain-containing protein, partial [Cyanobacteria bacterium J06600_6]
MLQLTANKVSVMAQKKIQDIYPLSPMQQGMLFHSLLEPNSGAYIIQTAYELHGLLDITAFAKSWQQLIDRHAILRTAFVWDSVKQPLQVVGTAAKISLIRHDWLEVSLSDRQNKLAEFLQELRTTGFNLNQAPLMRLDLIEMRSPSAGASASYYQFVWTYHHLLLDGWSVPLLIKELLGYYQSFAQDLNITLTPAVPYKNYIAWLKQQDTEQALNFWREELKDISAPTSLSIAKSKPDLKGSAANYQQCNLQLSAETTYKLEFLAREYQVTLNTIIQAAWAIILHRYSDSIDLIFGATTSGRPPNLANAQSIVGLFINTQSVRVQIDREQLLTKWLKQLQKKQIARQEYEYISLIDIHRVSDFPLDTALFQSIIVFENYPVESSLKQSLDVLDIRNVQTSEQTNYP